VSRSWGCVAAAKPNSVGSPSVISVQVSAPSSLRCMPTWFCWYRRSLSCGDLTSLWTQKPMSSYSRGQSARRPLLRGVHDPPSSVVSKMPTPCTIAKYRLGSSGWGRIAGTPRCPGGWFAGSFHDSRSGCPSSVV
jgi:hypothetical protein